eukprot:Lithocolla_globosa_v1_NODE_2411_length_2018_cov_7.299542.p2 type:complete len:168 gc:universal NODE_2411_length_2018_cov_7.299542:1679-1176(-)
MSVMLALRECKPTNSKVLQPTTSMESSTQNALERGRYPTNKQLNMRFQKQCQLALSPPSSPLTCCQTLPLCFSTMSKNISAKRAISSYLLLLDAGKKDHVGAVARASETICFVHWSVASTDSICSSSATRLARTEHCSSVGYWEARMARIPYSTFCPSLLSARCCNP